MRFWRKKKPAPRKSHAGVPMRVEVHEDDRMVLMSPGTVDRFVTPYGTISGKELGFLLREHFRPAQSVQAVHDPTIKVTLTLERPRMKRRK